MRIHHDIVASRLSAGMIVLWNDGTGSPEPTFVTASPVWDGVSEEYGTITLREQDGKGYEWEASIWMPGTYTVITADDADIPCECVTAGYPCECGTAGDGC